MAWGEAGPAHPNMSLQTIIPKYSGLRIVYKTGQMLLSLLRKPAVPVMTLRNPSTMLTMLAGPLQMKLEMGLRKGRGDMSTARTDGVLATLSISGNTFVVLHRSNG